MRYSNIIAKFGWSGNSLDKTAVNGDIIRRQLTAAIDSRAGILGGALAVSPALRFECSRHLEVPCEAG